MKKVNSKRAKVVFVVVVVVVDDDDDDDDVAAAAPVALFALLVLSVSKRHLALAVGRLATIYVV
jgi:hypothetical protein